MFNTKYSWADTPLGQSFQAWHMCNSLLYYCLYFMEWSPLAVHLSFIIHTS